MCTIIVEKRCVCVNFGERLKTLRKGQKLTQQELANRLGVAKSVVSYYESGDRFPSYDVLIKIARTFHVTTDYLLDIERNRTIDVTGLSEENIAVVVSVVNALKK
ncbi:MAG: helix-turn-helix transcriptional regulator [Ruminiclostridium sp.]|nr:helix-turn-helix transcriptional regulator [Ruminiclostridium sp.]